MLNFSIMSDTENVLESRTCKNCQQQFDVTDADQTFYNKLEVPRPTLCPDCRQQRRLAFRNERYMYKRKCDFSGKEIVSMYPPDVPFKIYDQEIWWSDKWNPLDYGKIFDFNRSFFEQFRELQLAVPRVALVNKQSENSAYTNHSGRNRNCYLSGVTFDCEDVYYSDWIMRAKDCVDCSYLIENCQLCYETYYAWSCYRAVFCDFVKNCSEIWFCYDCFGSQNCFMSSNLRNKKYCIRNQQYTKEGYEAEMKKIFPLSTEKLAALRKEYIQMKERLAIRPALYHVQVENSSGDLLFETKNCFHGFDSIKVEDCRYVYDAIEVKDSMDLYHVGIPAELTYECHAISNGYNCKFCHFVYDNSDLTYCDNCHNSRFLFGCVGLNQKKYCILNKQYSKEEYEALVPKIIEQMKKTQEYGEFFPIQFSPFAYNQSRAQEYYPLTKEQATKKGIRWSSFEAPLPDVKKIIKAAEVPVEIAKTSDEILDFAIECEVSRRPFKITKPELNFYRKMGLPVPRRHPDQRYLDRMAQRNPRKIWKRNCQKCGITVESSFAPERPSKVYCQKCYLGAIY